MNQELIRALRQTDALIVVYTSGTKDWSYVMYECGVATDESGDITNAYVFQCMNEDPVVFTDTFMINARKKSDIRRFCRQLFKSTDFFPKQSDAIAPNWVDTEIENVTDDLFGRLEKVLPSLDEELNRVVPIVPYLRIEVPATVTGEQSTSIDEHIRLTKEQIQQSALIAEHEPGAPRIFGMSAFAPTETLKSVYKTWMEISRTPNADWFEACCEHMASVALRRDAAPQWSTIRRPNGGEAFVPLVTQMVEVPKDGKVLFDTMLAALPDPRDLPVTSKMLKVNGFYYKALSKDTESCIRLVELIKDIDLKGRNRIPILNENGSVMYIVHRSLIERFWLASLSRTKSTSPQTSLHSRTCWRMPRSSERCARPFR